MSLIIVLASFKKKKKKRIADWFHTYVCILHLSAIEVLIPAVATDKLFASKMPPSGKEPALVTR